MDDDDDGSFHIPRCYLSELDAFFAAHARWLSGHACVRMRGDRELADDLVQDAFEAAAKAWTDLRAWDAARQRSWLLSVVRNKDISDFRRRQAFQRKQADIHTRYHGPDPDTETEAMHAIALEKSREIIEDMPDRQRTVALMLWHNMRAPEIAAELGITESSVYSHIHAARQKLIAGLGRYYPFGGAS